MRFYLTLSALLLARLGHAQSVTITGRVFDVKTNAPLSLASVVLKSQATGVLTKEDGTFELTKTSNQPDTLTIKSLGYTSKAAFVNGSAGDNLAIALQHELLARSPTTEAPLGKTLSLGTLSKMPGAGLIQGVRGSQCALLIPPDKPKKLGRIKSVSLFVGENGRPRTPFRVRLYTVVGPTQEPGADLLSESLLATASAGGDWCTVDLTAYHVVAPENGFFIAMEWLQECPTQSSEYTSFICGQIMRPTFSLKESRTWQYSFGRGWQQVTLRNGNSPFNAMMKAEVEIYK